MISARFIARCAQAGQIYITRHAAQRMVERRISTSDLIHALTTCQVIEQTPDDDPYPSCLVLGWLESGDPLHIKCSHKANSSVLRIVTVYEPDATRWGRRFRSRRK